MLRRIFFAGLSAGALSLLLLSVNPAAQAQAPAASTKPAKPAKAPAPVQPPAPVTLPPSKLNLCQYGFAYAHLKIKTRKLKVKSDSKPSIVKAKNGPNGDFIILIAGKNFGDSDVTITGEMEQGTTWVPFIQKITVSVVTCKKPKPSSAKPKNKGDDPEVPLFDVSKVICKGKSYYYTINLRARDGSTSLIHVNTVSSAPGVASANYDSGSQTVSGVGLKPGTATITVTGEVEAVDEDIPFTFTIEVTVLDCKSVEVCKGESVEVKMDNAAGATSGNPKVAVAGMIGNDVKVTGRDVGSATISVTGTGGKEVGRIDVIVKKCRVKPSKHTKKIHRAVRRTSNPTPAENQLLNTMIGVGIGIGLNRIGHHDEREQRDER